MTFFRSILIACLIAWSGHSTAGFVTLDESRIDDIFSQPSFGSRPIDIRFSQPQEVVRPDLLSIDDLWELSALWGAMPRQPYAINLYFVDQLNYCAGYNPYTVGCARVRGRFSAVESWWAQGSVGSALVAHELGHNLGLRHDVNSSARLMYPYLTGGVELTIPQAQVIHRSPYVWRDNQGYFVNVHPVAIVAEASTIPEPPMALLGSIVSVSLLIRLLRST